MADSPWEAEQVWGAIRREVVPVLEPLSAWIIDETGWVKQGDKSVGGCSPILRRGRQTSELSGQCRGGGQRWGDRRASGRPLVSAGKVDRRLGAVRGGRRATGPTVSDQAGHRSRLSEADARCRREPGTGVGR